MRHFTSSMAVMACALLVSAAAAEAQQAGTAARQQRQQADQGGRDERPSGFMLGIHSLGVTGIEINYKNDGHPFNTKAGAGAELTLGYGFTKTLAAFSSLAVARQKTVPTEWPDGNWGLAQLDLGLRANLPLGSASTIPYAKASLGARALAARALFDDGRTLDASVSGRFVSLGGGIEHAVSRSLSLDVGADLSLGKLGEFKAGDEQWTEEVDPTKTFRFRLGINWRPRAPKT